MANDDFDLPQEWDADEVSLFLNLIDNAYGGQAESDPELKELFDAALFDPDISARDREDAYEDLVDYLWDVYGIDFDEMFDWEDYREWYDAG